MGFQDTQQAAHFTNIHVMVKEALRNKCWIFNTYNKEWHSPEEFLSKFEKQTYSQGWIENFKIMNPYAGLKAADIMEQKLREKRLLFQQRVFNYYQNKSK